MTDFVYWLYGCVRLRAELAMGQNTMVVERVSKIDDVHAIGDFIRLVNGLEADGWQVTDTNTR